MLAESGTAEIRTRDLLSRKCNVLTIMPPGHSVFGDCYFVYRILLGGKFIAKNVIINITMNNQKITHNRTENLQILFMVRICTNVTLNYKKIIDIGRYLLKLFENFAGVRFFLNVHSVYVCVRKDIDHCGKLTVHFPSTCSSSHTLTSSTDIIQLVVLAVVAPLRPL